ncbi:hypothetical protein AA309_28655 [Microvirga vignae]|uniref:Uncharacterized protein n=1 Tax=Microvirga vignae TaxID=1225564 RepID=A0A0H1R483_9HYPH|nr:hypothetical protein AA309_28655 [Microvirga vignae]
MCAGGETAALIGCERCPLRLFSQTRTCFGKDTAGESIMRPLKRHELGECGLTGLRERCATNPSANADEVHGSHRQHVLQMRFGETDVAGAPQMQDPDARRDCSLNSSSPQIFSCEGWLRFTDPSGLKGLMILLAGVA